MIAITSCARHSKFPEAVNLPKIYCTSYICTLECHNFYLSWMENHAKAKFASFLWLFAHSRCEIHLQIFAKSHSKYHIRLEFNPFCAVLLSKWIAHGQIHHAFIESDQSQPNFLNTTKCRSLRLSDTYSAANWNSITLIVNCNAFLALQIFHRLIHGFNNSTLSACI